MAAATLTWAASAFSASFTVTDLGTLRGGGSFPRGINASGEVVGNSDGRAFLYSNGTMTDLDPLFPGNNVALGINNSGQVVGWSQDAAGNLHAFLFSGGRTTDLGLGRNSEAVGINSRGQVAGWFEGSDGNTHAFLMSGSSMTTLFDSSVYSIASAINDSGQVVGWFTSGTAEHAFLYIQGVVTDLGTLNGLQTMAYAVNASGKVVGSPAFLYSGGVMTTFGPVAGYGVIPGNASGINAAGQVVGSFTYDTPSGAFLSGGVSGKFCLNSCGPPMSGGAWLYSDGAVLALMSLVDPNGGYQILEATGINDAGQIIAFGCDEEGCTRALLLTPVKTTVVEYQNTEDFPGSPGGHFFYTDDPGEQAIVDSGGDGHFVRTGKTFNAGGSKRACRFYGSVVPGPNSHFYTVSDQECDALKAQQQVPTPTDVQQWNYEGLVFSEVPPLAGYTGPSSCTAGTIPVYRGYNNAYPASGAKNPWDSAHRYSTQQADIEQLVAQSGWSNEGIAFCSPQ